MTNNYLELVKAEQKRFDELPIKFAFSDEQLKKGLVELGLKETDTDKVYKVTQNAFMKKEDIHLFKEFLEENERAMSEAMASDKDGTGFLLEMFEFELSNHEYNITYSVDDTLEALNLTVEDIKKDDRLRKALDNAKDNVLKNSKW